MERRGDAMNWSAIGAIFLALAVGLGAFGAHGLKDRLDAYSLGIWEKAVFYHFIHSLGMLVVSLLPRTGTFPSNGASSVCWLLAAGVLIFSGRLYTLALTGVRTMGAITPVGGGGFIAAGLLRPPPAGPLPPGRRGVFHRGVAAAGLLLYRTESVNHDESSTGGSGRHSAAGNDSARLRNGPPGRGNRAGRRRAAEGRAGLGGPDRAALVFAR